MSWTFDNLEERVQQNDSPAVRTPPSSPGRPYSTTTTELSGCSEVALLPRKPWRDGEPTGTPCSWSQSRQDELHSWKHPNVSVSELATAHFLQTWTTVVRDLWPLGPRWVAEVSLDVLHVLQVRPGGAIKHLPLVRQVEVHTSAVVCTQTQTAPHQTSIQIMLILQNHWRIFTSSPEPVKKLF